MKKKAAAKRTESVAVASGNRDAKGRLLPGHSIPGPGRPALPPWMKQKAPEALDYIWRVAMGEEAVDDDALRMRAAETIVGYVFGKPGKARVGETPDMTHEEKVQALERIVLEAAQHGDVEAARALLAALEPTKWGKKSDDGGNDDQVDTLDFVPMVRTETVTTTTAAVAVRKQEG